MQRRAVAELVAARVAVAVELLGCGVRRRAEQRARLREVHACRRAVAALDPHEPEVGDDDAAAVGDEHVVGLDVAMHEAGGVDRRDAAPGRDARGEDLAPRAAGGEPLPQCRATPASNTAITFGCEICAAARASRSSRTRCESVRSSLIATRRSSCGSIASYTMPIAPLPSTDWIW